MRVVLDANVFVALYVDLAYSPEARLAVAQATEIIAPDLILHETVNTLWKLTAAEAITPGHAGQAIAALATAFNEIAPALELAPEAFALALKTKHSAYDCFYLGLAIARGATLITADKRLAQIAGSIEAGPACVMVKPASPE